MSLFIGVSLAYKVMAKKFARPFNCHGVSDCESGAVVVAKAARSLTIEFEIIEVGIACMVMRVVMVLSQMFKARRGVEKWCSADETGERRTTLVRISGLSELSGI